MSAGLLSVPQAGLVVAVANVTFRTLNARKENVRALRINAGTGTLSVVFDGNTTPVVYKGLAVGDVIEGDFEGIRASGSTVAEVIALW